MSLNPIMEFKYSKEQIMDFNPNDWEFGRSSGYAGYYKKSSTLWNRESEWIYLEDYTERLKLKRLYEYDYKLLSSFRSDCLPFGEYPEYVIQNFLDKKFGW